MRGTTITVVEASTWRSKTLQELDDLRLRAAELEIGDPTTLTFCLPDLADPEALRALCESSKSMVGAASPAIYCFEMERLELGEAMMRAFEDRLLTCPETQRAFRYSRVNPTAGTTTLYVGSSKSFASRFSQHLGRTGSPGTYSMRLANWATEIDASISVSVWTFDTGISQAVLELYEQALWDLRQPLLGKRSGK